MNQLQARAYRFPLASADGTVDAQRYGTRINRIAVLLTVNK